MRGIIDGAGGWNRYREGDAAVAAHVDHLRRASGGDIGDIPSVIIT